MSAIREGTWFAVPLRTKGFAVGVVARTTAPGGIVLAYFFPAVWDTPPGIDEVEALPPRMAVRVLRVGDLGLTDGTWQIIGIDPGWRREDWSVPKFVRRDELSRRAWIVEYSDTDANIVVSESPADDGTGLERDAVLGAGAAEIVMTKLLSGG